MTQKLNIDNGLLGRWAEIPAHNSSYQKGGVSCSKDILVVNETLVFQIKFCTENRHLSQARNRWQIGKRRQLKHKQILTL